MSQAVGRREPNLKRYTEQEINEMSLRACQMMGDGRKEEADELLNEIPLHWKSAKILKEMVGVESMIESGINLSEAVDHYGYEWLER